MGNFVGKVDISAKILDFLLFHFISSKIYILQIYLLNIKSFDKIWRKQNCEKFSYISLFLDEFNYSLSTPGISAFICTHEIININTI